MASNNEKSPYNEDIMAKLLDMAAAAAAVGEVPVAAAIIGPDGTVVAAAENRMVRDNSAVAHAEMLAITAAMSARGTARLDECDLWVTLEPCTMCAGAIAHARLRRVYFAARDEKAGAVESGVRFFDQPSCHHHPDIYGGLSEAAAARQLKDFFANRRK